MHFAIIVGYVLAAALNVIALRYVKLRLLQLIDGVVIGMLYYITIPMFFILAAGRIGPSFIKISDYLPFEDTSTTGVILIGMVAISCLKIALSYLNRPTIGKSVNRCTGKSNYYQVCLVVILFSLTIGLSVIQFVMSGVGGKHWFEAGEDIANQGFAFLIIPIMLNFSRTALFGALAAITLWQTTSPLRKWCVPIGLFAALVNVALVFNRISILYFLLLVIIQYRKRLFAVSTTVLIALLSFAQLSTVWTYFRSFVSLYGFSPGTIADGVGWAFSTAAKSGSDSFVDRMNGAFESINITVLNWAVRYGDRLQVPFGSYIVRPVTVIVPRSIWPDRPVTFPTLLAQTISGQGALNSTLFAEAYVNSPVFWPVLLLGAITVYDAIYRKLALRNPAWGVIGAFVGVAWWRFDASFPVMCLILSVALAMTLSFVVPNRRGLMRAPQHSRAVRS